MYTNRNFKTKKQLKEAIASGEKVFVVQPGLTGVHAPDNGTVYLEGPHDPEPHRWYAEATMKGGYVVKVK